MKEENKEAENRPKFDFGKLQDFLSQNPSFSQKDGAKAIFGLGVLVQLVFGLQYENLKSTPFENKLKGLHLSPKDADRIFKDAIAKIKEYEKAKKYGNQQIYYKELREFIAENLMMHKPEIDKMSNNEISFNFVCGLELGRKFKS